MIAAVMDEVMSGDAPRIGTKNGEMAFCPWCEVYELLGDADQEEDGIWCAECGASLLREPVEVVEEVIEGRRIPVQFVA